MTTATQNLPANLVADIANLLTRLRQARADGDPNHNTQTCQGCSICVLQRQLDRLIDKLPRQAQ